MRFRRSLVGEPEPAEINISPLIDMVFILLIFFIVTTEFVAERGVPVKKTQAASSKSPDERNIVFVISGGGEVIHRDIALGAGGVAAIVRTEGRAGELPVVLDVQRGAIAGLVVRVIDEARAAGAKSVSLATSAE